MAIHFQHYVASSEKQQQQQNHNIPKRSLQGLKTEDGQLLKIFVIFGLTSVLSLLLSLQQKIMIDKSLLWCVGLLS